MLNAVLKTCLLLNIFSKEINEMFILIPFIYFVGPINSCKTIMMSFSNYTEYLNGSRAGTIFPKWLNVIYRDDLRVNDFMIYNNRKRYLLLVITNILHERAYYFVNEFLELRMNHTVPLVI